MYEKKTFSEDLHLSLGRDWIDRYSHYSQPQWKTSSQYPETMTSITPEVN